MYRRLFALVFLANAAVIFLIGAERAWGHQDIWVFDSFTYGQAATAVIAKLFVTTLTKHEHFINLLFRTASSTRYCMPLRVRKYAAKIYCCSGIRSGCGVSALLWYAFFVILVIEQVPALPEFGMALGITTGSLVLLLILLVCMSHPSIRKKKSRYVGAQPLISWLNCCCSSVVLGTRYGHFRCYTR